MHCQICNKTFSEGNFFRHMRQEHGAKRAGRSVREKMLEKHQPITDQSYLGFNDMVDLFQSHISLHYCRQYEDLRIIFLKRSVFINDDDNNIAALSTLSPSKFHTRDSIDTT